jgi:hypothetical protein
MTLPTFSYSISVEILKGVTGSQRTTVSLQPVKISTVKLRRVAVVSVMHVVMLVIRPIQVRSLAHHLQLLLHWMTRCILLAIPVLRNMIVENAQPVGAIVIKIVTAKKG